MWKETMKTDLEYLNLREDFKQKKAQRHDMIHTTDPTQ